jgi:hypothetical protein
VKREPLDTSGFQQLVTDSNYCAVTARIIYEGQKVRFMYRESPVNDTDSGWQFLAGTETDDYLANPDNAGMYRLNTISNFDSAVIPYLGYPVRTDLECVEGSNEFVVIN